MDGKQDEDEKELGGVIMKIAKVISVVDDEWFI